MSGIFLDEVYILKISHLAFRNQLIFDHIPSNKVTLGLRARKAATVRDNVHEVLHEKRTWRLIEVYDEGAPK